MENNSSNEMSEKLVLLEIKNKKEMLNLYDDVIEALAKFDGKQITKRLETALRKDVSANLRVCREYNSFIIKWYISDRSIQGEKWTHYLNDTYYNLVWGACHNGYEPDLDILNYGEIKETLNYNNLKKELLKQKEYLENSIAKIETALLDVDILIKEAKELETKCNEFNAKKNTTVSSYYDIKSFYAR